MSSPITRGRETQKTKGKIIKKDLEVNNLFNITYERTLRRCLIKCYQPLMLEKD